MPGSSPLCCEFDRERKVLLQSANSDAAAVLGSAVRVASHPGGRLDPTGDIFPPAVRPHVLPEPPFLLAWALCDRHRDGAGITASCLEAGPCRGHTVPNPAARPWPHPQGFSWVSPPSARHQTPRCPAAPASPSLPLSLPRWFCPFPLSLLEAVACLHGDLPRSRAVFWPLAILNN